jgi:ABC-type multidrug transport system fused ATPase/permease subunit
MAFLPFPARSPCSTIVALLQRFYDVQEGRVLLDGHDYKSLKLSSLHSHMAVVTQVTELFAGTIRENLVYGMPGEEDHQVSMADIEEACKQANAHDFIMQVSKCTHAYYRPPNE